MTRLSPSQVALPTVAPGKFPTITISYAFFFGSHENISWPISFPIGPFSSKSAITENPPGPSCALYQPVAFPPSPVIGSFQILGLPCPTRRSKNSASAFPARASGACPSCLAASAISRECSRAHIVTVANSAGQSNQNRSSSHIIILLFGLFLSQRFRFLTARNVAGNARMSSHFWVILHREAINHLSAGVNELTGGASRQVRVHRPRIATAFPCE